MKSFTRTGLLSRCKIVGAMLCIVLSGAIVVQVSAAEMPIWEHGIKAASAGQGMSEEGGPSIAGLTASSVEDTGTEDAAGDSSNQMKIAIAEIRAEGVNN